MMIAAILKIKLNFRKKSEKYLANFNRSLFCYYQNFRSLIPQIFPQIYGIDDFQTSSSELSKIEGMSLEVDFLMLMRS